ncbi:MAG: protein kinase [Pseudomonadota bacterium]
MTFEANDNRAGETENEALKLVEDALDQPAGERAAFVKAAPGFSAAARERAMAILEADDAGESLDSSVITGGGLQFAQAPPPETVGAYRIEREVGRGGMGAVYLGRRIAGDFDHTAAIKIVSAGARGKKLAVRLKAERATLARLKHPNIAQLYDGGEMDDGAPYFIMEYVDGAPLNIYLQQQNPPLNERLQIFSDIAAAVAFAHRNLIIHRDLSPANALVAKDGAVKLIDFGISHSVGDASAEHADGPRLTMTEGYAAPERARGEPATTAADIYALGVILSDLIDNIDAPRRRDLEAIAAKARAPAPDDRYAGVAAMLADLDAYRAGKPVSAVSGGWPYELSRFAARHRLGVAAAGLAAFSALAAGLVMAVLYVRADQAQREATARFDDVRALAGAMIYDVYGEIEALPGATRARRTVAEAAQIYLDKLAADERASPDLIIETARGFTELGRIMASPSRGSFEDAPAADQHFEKARALLERFAEGDTQNVAALLALGELNLAVAEISIQPRDDLDKARAQLAAAEDYLRAGLRIDPDNDDLKAALVAVRAEGATPLYRDDKHDEARAQSRSTIAEAESLLENRPDDVRLHRLLNKTRRALAVSLNNDPATRAEAIEVYAKAVEDLEAAQALSERDVNIAALRAKSHRGLGSALYLDQRHSEAVDEYQKAIDIAADIVAADPYDKNAQLDLVIFKGEITAPLSSLERFEEAEKLLLEARDWYQARYEEEPDNPTRQRRVWVHSYFLASHYRLRGNTQESCKHMDAMEAMAQLRRKAGTLQEVDAANYENIIKKEYAECFTG